MKIEPGIGVGEIRYGITEPELVALLGEPSTSTKEEYIEGSGDWHVTLSYEDHGMSFIFDIEDDYRLGGITIDREGYQLWGKDVFGISRDEMESMLLKVTGEQPIFEDYSTDDLEPHWCLIHDRTQIMFWFDSDKLSEMQCSYFFEDDDETVIWP